MNEKTNTTPSDGKESFPELKEFNEMLMQVYITIINAAFTLDKPLYQWILSMVIMIKKKTITSNSHRLRVIHKFEANYNLILRLFWPKKVTQLTEQRQTLQVN